MARASAPASPAGTRTPVSFSTTISGIPPIAVEMTGRPVAIASMITVGRLSIPPSGPITLGSTKTVPAAKRSAISCCGFAPSSLTQFCRSSRSICARNSVSTGPSPMISQRNNCPRSFSNRQAWIKSGNPFLSIKRPIATMAGGAAEKSARLNSARSNPL